MNNLESNQIQSLTVFNKSSLLGKEIDVYGDAENPLFRAKDVAEWIEHSNPRVMLASVDDDEKGVRNVYTLGGSQEAWFLTENGLYEVLMQSRKPIAKEFKKGIKVILHEIRTKGGYMATQQDDTPEVIMARAILLAQETMKRQKEQIQSLETKSQEQQKKIDKQKPFVDFAKNAFQAEGKVDIGQAAKILKLPFGRNKLFKKLREDGIFFSSRNEPKQRFVDAKYFELTQLPPMVIGGKEYIKTKVLCTQKGLAYINMLYGVKEEVAV